MHETQATLNVRSDSSDWRAHVLSNLACTPFHIGDGLFVSVEGLIQGIKYPEGHPRREECFKSWGQKAQRLSPTSESEYIWWKGEQTPYGGKNHRQIIAEAIYAKFFYNTGARVALAQTEGLELIHDVGPDLPNTSLPASVFCAILTDVRTQLSPIL